MDKKVPALRMQRCRTNLCAAKILKKKSANLSGREQQAKESRELSNTYLLAKFGFHIAENEPCQVCPTEQCSQVDPESPDAREVARLLASRMIEAGGAFSALSATDLGWALGAVETGLLGKLAN